MSVVRFPTIQHFGLLPRKAVFALLACAATFAMVRGAEVRTRSFDLPADLLENTIKRFAAQSELEVLIPSDALAEVRTRPVRGEMTSRAALEAMLVGTGLIPLQDPKTGAFTLRKKEFGPKRKPPVATAGESVGHAKKN